MKLYNVTVNCTLNEDYNFTVWADSEEEAEATAKEIALDDASSDIDAELTGIDIAGDDSDD